MKQSRAAQGAVLSQHELETKLLSKELVDRLVVAPLDNLPHSSSIDIRLGSKFIMTRLSQQGSLDPRTVTPEFLRQAQEKIEIRFDEELVLHPRGLILASTLEYVSLPPDLAAVVSTRSTYGRLGLITATAAFVHPGYKGCITLELLNLGNTPVVLCPGLEVAQLVFYWASPSTPHQSRYLLATGPEYPIVTPAEQQRLNQMRIRWVTE